MSIIFCIDHIAHGLHKMRQVPLRCKMLWMKVSRWRSSLRSKVDSGDKIEHCAMQCCCVVCYALQQNASYCSCASAMQQRNAVQCSATLAKVLWLPPITAHCFRPQWATPIRLCFNANQSTADQCNVSVQCISAMYQNVVFRKVRTAVRWVRWCIDVAAESDDQPGFN